MRSVCFFMVYHGRSAITKMAISHMYHTMWMFEDNGFTVDGLVIGDDPGIESFAMDLGIRHESFRNDPVSHKFTYAWLRAVQSQCDYVCWLGSNNIHGAGYWESAMERLKGNLVATFGTRNCVILSAKAEEEETCLFTPSEKYLISAGQFFLRYSLVNSVNLLTVYDDDQTFAFDGSIMDAMMGKWGHDIVEVIEYDEEDCLDVKGTTNIHSYESYMQVPFYPEYQSRSQIQGRHPHLHNLLIGTYGEIE